ncbi:MAG: hypothetical protein VX589_21650 [Myxococcota bacterium]|nr:hypothetical protein [Myxococcota bacterium]
MRFIVVTLAGIFTLSTAAVAEPKPSDSVNADLKEVLRATAFPADLIIKTGVVRAGQVRLIRTPTTSTKKIVQPVTTPLLRRQKRDLLGQSQRVPTRIHVRRSQPGEPSASPSN